MKNKNDILTLFILILIFALFIFNFEKSQEIKSFKIIDITETNDFYIDFNNDKIPQKEELTKLKDIKIYSPIKNNQIEKEAQDLNLEIMDYLKNGFLAQEFLKEYFLNKNVKVTYKYFDKNKNYNIVQIKDENGDIAIQLLKNGLAYLDINSKNASYFQHLNQKQTKLNSKETQKVEFYIINLKNKILHKLNCEYAKLINNGILTTSEEEVIPCKICLKELKEKQEREKLFLSQKEYRKSQSKVFDEIEIFLLNPLEHKSPNKKCSNELCKAILREINNAQKTIDIAIYGFGEQEEIIYALKRAKERSVEIKVVTDESKNTQTIYPNTYILRKEFLSSKDGFESLMHNKFFIFDDKKVLTGSANISSTDSGGYSANIMTLINSPKLASYYKEEFNQMFKGKYSKNKHQIKKEKVVLKNSTLEAFFTPKDNILNEKVLPMVKNSKKEIFVSIFYLTNKPLIEELIKAKQRGVNVVIIIDALGAGNFKERIEPLRKAGIPTKVENWGGKNHEKTMLIDNEFLIIGSSNFSKNAFNKNDENVLIIENKQIASFYRDYFIYLFNSIDNKFLNLYPKAEGKESVNSCHDGIDNDFDGKIDAQDSACQI